MKQNFLLTVLMTGSWLLGTATAQMDLKSLKVSAQVATRESDAPREVVLGDIPLKSTAEMVIPGRFSSLRPQNGLSDSEYAAMKLAASKVRNGAIRTNLVSPAIAKGPDTPSPSAIFVGVDESCSNVTPSDMAVAVGPNFELQVVNDCMAVFDRSGVLQTGFPKSINTFFGLPANNFAIGRTMTDPRAFYDNVAGRFVFLALFEDFPNSRGFVEIAVSQTKDPRGAWFLSQIQVGGDGQCPDFPALGQGRNGDKFVGAVAVGFNVFSCNTKGFTAFHDDQIFFLPKKTLYAGKPLSFNLVTDLTLGGIPVDTVQPVNVAFPDESPRTQFAVNSLNINFGGSVCANGCNGLVVWSFSNVAPNPGSPGLVFSGQFINTPCSYSLAADASQPFFRNSIDSGDTRITGTAQYAGGSIYATLDTNNGGLGSAILAYQIHAFLNDNGDGHCTGDFLNACPTLVGAGVDNEFSYGIGGGTIANAYFGTLQPDAERNLTMVFNFSGDNFFPGVAVVSNRATQAPGNWHDAGIFLCAGRGLYTQQRWGDYTGTSIETSSLERMWVSGMFSDGSGNWSTCIGKNGYVSANQP
jgi:hypothetical protein